MHYRRLGDAGMKVSTISLGGWINYEAGKIPPESARQVVETAYENGINFYDLADVYGTGSAEEQMGQLLARYPRHTLVISTKVFGKMSEDVNDSGLSRKHIMESVVKSLRRLGTDYIDIYFCHRPDPQTPLLETIRAMDDLIKQGKVLYWGTSEWEAEALAETLRLCEHYNLHKPKTEQPQYSLLCRQRVESQILPVTHPNGIGLVVWSPLGMGMLTGKYDDGIPDESRFAKEAWAKDRYLPAVGQVKQMKPIADDLGLTRSQLALAWTLRQPGVSSAIIGATRAEQVLDNVKAGEVTLSADVIAQLDALFSPTL